MHKDDVDASDGARTTDSQPDPARATNRTLSKMPEPRLIAQRSSHGRRPHSCIARRADIMRALFHEDVPMDWKIFATVFAAVFIAELGDKTQLATMLFASDKDVSKWTIFLGASAALIVASGIGVLAGSLLSEYINEKYLHYAAGAGFILIGAVTLARA